MKNFLLLAAIAAVSLSISAQEYTVEKLWGSEEVPSSANFRQSVGLNGRFYINDKSTQTVWVYDEYGFHPQFVGGENCGIGRDQAGHIIVSLASFPSTNTWVFDDGTPMIRVIDPESGEVTDLPLGSGAPNDGRLDMLGRAYGNILEDGELYLPYLPYLQNEGKINRRFYNNGEVCGEDCYAAVLSPSAKADLSTIVKAVVDAAGNDAVFYYQRYNNPYLYYWNDNNLDGYQISIPEFDDGLIRCDQNGADFFAYNGKNFVVFPCSDSSNGYFDGFAIYEIGADAPFFVKAPTITNAPNVFQANWLDAEVTQNGVLIYQYVPGKSMEVYKMSLSNEEVPDVYILGMVNGYDGFADEGVKMDYNDSTGLYTATVTIGEKLDKGKGDYVEIDGYIIFSNKLAAYENGWSEIQSYLFGATGDEDFEVTDSLMGKSISLTYDNPQDLQFPYGEYTLSLNLDNLTLVIRKAAVNDTVFILGNIDDNDWAANVGVQMDRFSSCRRDRARILRNGVPDEDNKDDKDDKDDKEDDYSNCFEAYITADGRDNGYNTFSFSTKLAGYANDWDSIAPYRFGAVSQGDFLVTDEMLEEDLSLTYDNPQAFRIPKGEYYLFLDLDSLTLYIEDMTPIPDVFILGEVNGNSWDPDEGVQMSNVGKGLYTATITVDGRNNGYNYFSFTTELGDDWADIASYRFGAVSQGDFWVTSNMLDTEIALTYDNPQAFRIPAGEYYLDLNLDSLKLVIRDAMRGYCGNSNVNNGKNVCYEVTGTGNERTLTISKNPAAVGNDFSMADYDEPFFSQLKPAVLVINDGVTSIGKCAFEDCENLTSVTIGNSVTTIGESAFESCWSLSSLTIPNSVTTIGEKAFKWCSSMESVNIPNNVTTIGVSAFQGCDGLLSLTIGSGVTTIADNTFFSCSSLTSVTIGSGVTTIGKHAFEDCNDLPSIIIPDKVTTLGENAFASCDSLTSVTIGSRVTTIGKHAFEDCNGLPSITIPDNVTTIDENAFHACRNLSSVTIGSGVTTIGESAFDDCSSLPSITIPDNVTTIDENAFHACRNLSSVTIGSGVKTIGNSAFEYCNKLTTLTIPQSVTFIGNNAFFWCFAMEDVYCYALPNKLTWNEDGCNDFKDGRATRCHVYDLSSWSSFESAVNVTFVEDIPVKFYDTADNNDLVSSLSDKTKEVTLADHTFIADGSWNTLCLPFSLTSLTGTPLEGFTVKELDTSTTVNDHITGLEDGTLYLNFKDANGIEAGKPYLVKKEMGDATYVSCTADKGTDAQTGLGNNTFDYHGLVDGTTNRRWRTNGPTANNPCYCEFHTADAVTMTRYEIAATNLAEYSNPKVWTLYGKLNENDAWTVIDSRDTGANPGDALPNATKTKKFNIAAENQGAYKFYRFEVTQIVDPSVASIMVVSELYMYGAQTAIENPVFSNVTIKGDAPAIVSSNDGKIAFVGSYAPRTSNSGMLCISSGNRIGRLAKGQKTGAQHAAFLTGINSEGKPVGDVNSDNDVTILDVTILVNLILNNTTFPAIADVNGDGTVNVTDVTSLVDIILGKSSIVINDVVTNVDLIYSGTGVSPARTKNN